jgi:hypothetical protein
MAEVKISALTSATTPLAGTEVVPIVQGGVTKKVAVSNFGGAAVNPTSTYIPYNNSGTFADSGLNYSSNVVKTIFDGLTSINKQGGIRITGNSGTPNNNFTTEIGDYLGTTGQTVFTVYSNGNITGSTGNGAIQFNANGGVTLQDVTLTNRVVLGGSELQWNGSFGGAKGGSAFSIPIYLSGLGMTVHIPLYM